MRRQVRMDIESKSELDLTKVGLDVYSAHPSTAITIICYQITEKDGTVGPRKRVENGNQAVEIPDDLRECLQDGETDKIAFNAQFERVMFIRVGGIDTPYKGWKCTMVRGFGAAFTGNLEEMAGQIGIDAKLMKDKRGKALIKMFSMPQKITKNQPHRWLSAETHPKEWREFCDYCEQDVVAESAIWDWLAPLHFPDIEWQYYEIDQRINDRGMPVNVDFCRKAYAMYERFAERIRQRIVDLTGISNANSPAQLTAWLKGEGYWFDDIGGATVEKVINENADHGWPVSDIGIEVLKLRQKCSFSSTKKYLKFAEMAGRRSVIRFSLQFGGAARTFRDAGRGGQTQNLMRPPKYFENEDVVFACVEAVIDEDDDMFEFLLGEDATEALAGLVRSSFQAPEGYEFRVCDLSSIESRSLAFMTFCKRLQAVFEAGKDPYKDFGVEFYGKPYEQITKAERNICKPPTLGCGYRLGGGEMRAGKKTGLWGYAENMGVMISRSDSHKAVKLWRETYPEVPETWKRYEAAVLEAMQTGKTVKSHPVEFKKVHNKGTNFLRVKLPSGRCLWYHRPRMMWQKVSTGRFTTEIDIDTGAEIQVEETFDSYAFTYMGKEQNGHVWMRLTNHGGRWVEQIDQAMSRDVMWEGCHKAVKAGFAVIGRVHDEIITLAKKTNIIHTVERLRELMIAPTNWWKGLILDAAGWSGPFYKKD